MGAQSSGAAPPTARLVHWARQVVHLVVKYQQNPLRAARSLSYVHVAMHDAWVHSQRLAPPASAHAAEFAAHRAASLVIEQLYPNETPGQFEAQACLFEQALALSPTQMQAARAVGTQVARALIERSLRDGAGRVWPLKNRPADFPGIWQATYPMFAVNPTEAQAAQWRTWVEPSPGRYAPPVAARPGSAAHARETREVLEVARALTQVQKHAALEWNLDAGSVTPGGVWMELAVEELSRMRADAGLALPLLASLGVALHDAFVACWRVKLRDWSERPITSIRRDLDPGFAPLLVTPGFPSYVSGHATVSAAAATVLGHFLADPSLRFQAMAREAAMSRLWGGIHFRGDNEEGLRLGSAVGGEVVAHAAGSA